MNDTLATAEIERACVQLVTRYARATDVGDAEGAGLCFTADGELDMPGGRSYRGREAIAQRLAEQPPVQVSRHVLSNISIEVHGADRATGTLYVTMYRGNRPKAPGPVPLDAGPFLIGEYDDEYRLTAEGWRIARRRLTTIFRRDIP